MFTRFCQLSQLRSTTYLGRSHFVVIKWGLSCYQYGISGSRLKPCWPAISQLATFPKNISGNIRLMLD